VNRSILALGPPGEMQLWPGPAVFFAFQYNTPPPDMHGASTNLTTSTPADVSDGFLTISYGAGSSKRGNEAKTSAVNGNDPTPEGDASKAPEICKILDFSKQDFYNTIHYLRYLETNVSSPNDKKNPWGTVGMTRATRVSQVTPGRVYGKLKINAPRATHRAGGGIGPVMSLQDILINVKDRPCPAMAIAYAVGLPWHIVPLNITTPPFRWAETPNQMSRSPHLGILTRPLEIEKREAKRKVNPLRSPTMPLYDNFAIVHACGAQVSRHHVYALMQYVRHTDPEHWSRTGEHGFETYWRRNVWKILNACTRTGWFTSGYDLGPYSMEPHNTKGDPLDLVVTTDREMPWELFRALGEAGSDKRTSFFRWSIIGNSLEMKRWRGSTETWADLRREKMTMMEILNFFIISRSLGSETRSRFSKKLPVLSGRFKQRWDPDSERAVRRHGCNQSWEEVYGPLKSLASVSHRGEGISQPPEFYTMLNYGTSSESRSDASTEDKKPLHDAIQPGVRERVGSISAPTDAELEAEKTKKDRVQQRAEQVARRTKG